MITILCQFVALNMVYNFAAENLFPISTAQTKQIIFTGKVYDEWEKGGLLHTHYYTTNTALGHASNDTLTATELRKALRLLRSIFYTHRQPN